MWLGHSDGWLSIVEHRDDSTLLLVRARKESHITSIWGDIDVTHMPDADYPYRVNLDREVVKDGLCEYIERIDYDNFKNSVKERRLKDAFEHIWAVMYRYGVEYRDE